MEKIKIRLEDAGVSGGDDVVKEYKETTEREKLRATYLSEATNQTSPLFNKTTRQKTTPIRLAHTIAKAKQHETIQLEDLKDAIELIR